METRESNKGGGGARDLNPQFRKAGGFQVPRKCQGLLCKEKLKRGETEGGKGKVKRGGGGS